MIDTTTRSIAEVIGAVQAVEQVAHDLPPGRQATIVELGDRSYPVAIGDGAVDGELIAAAVAGASKLALITDRNVAGHWLATATAALPPIEVVELAPGEASKSFAVFEQVCASLVARGLDRGSAILALGGGVVGDLAGFVAASLFRGIPIIQLPTTIVAMTDAAIGGKTAIDLPAGKNLIGAFWQPRLVACGLELLTTLPGRERRAGFGELWKYALLDGAGLWAAVASCAAWAAGPDDVAPPPTMRDVIERSIAYKAAIVGRDERERRGHRVLLNLGHTIGHAIETEAAGAVLHGEAVGLGLLAACRVSTAVAGGPAGLEARVAGALRSTGLPVDLDRWLTEAVLARVVVDKKRIGANLGFVVVREVGACEPAEIAVTEVRRILRNKPTA